MKKIGFIIFAAALVGGVLVANFTSIGGRTLKSPFSFFFGSKIHGSGNIVTKNRNVGEFKAIEIGGILNVEIVQAEKYSVTVEADDNILPTIITEVDDGVLRIWSESKFKSAHGVVIRVSAPSIEELETSGVSRASFSSINGDLLRVNTSGASKVSLEGTIKNLELDMSGASGVNAADLTANHASVGGSGASSARVEVVSFLEADLSGASSVNYKGNPAELKKSVSGGSSVTKID